MSARATGAGLALALTLAAPAAAPAAGDGWRLDLGAGIGAIVLDEDLRDYRWDVAPATALDLHATARRGRFATGLNLLTTSTVQATGIPGETAAPEVGLHLLETDVALRALDWRGLELWARAHGGRMFLRYDPERLELASPGGGAPIAVDYAPIDEWTAGLGVELRREFMARVVVAARITHSVFALDTAHRSGDAIVQERRSFDHWSFGLGASWLLDL